MTTFASTLSDHLQMFPLSLGNSRRAEKGLRKGTRRRNWENQSSPEGQSVSFKTLLPELMPLIWFILHFRAAVFTQWLRIIVKVCVCVCRGWVNGWTLIKRWQWTIKKTDVEIKSVKIWYIVPSHCLPQLLFQKYCCFSVPEIIQNHSLSSFPHPVQCGWREPQGWWW